MWRGGFGVFVLFFIFPCLGSELGQVVDLDFFSFGDKVNDGRWLIEFYSTRCKHCTQFAPTYEKIAQTLGKEGIMVGRINGDSNKSLMEKFDVHHYPSLFVVEGDKAYPFTGDRSHNAVVKFAQNAEALSKSSLPLGRSWHEQAVHFFLSVPRHIYRVYTGEEEFSAHNITLPFVVATGLTLLLGSALAVYFLVELMDPPGRRDAPR
eukprot:Rmarinus@m.29042